MPDNKMRAYQGSVILGHMKTYSGEDPEEQLVDLLTNLMHMCYFDGELKFADALRIATYHYESENGQPRSEMELEHYHRLHEGLSDMIEGGRLKEIDIPDDYQWLVELLAEVPKQPSIVKQLDRALRSSWKCLMRARCISCDNCEDDTDCPIKQIKKLMPDLTEGK